MRLVALCLVLSLLLGVPSALAGRGGSHGNASATASCSVSGDVVSAAGLPVGEVVNFVITADSGTWGWVLGVPDDGTWTVVVPAVAGPLSYAFVGRTRGADGSKYDVFASC